MIREIKTPYDSYAMRCVTRELSDLLVGGLIQRITQPSDHDLVWEVRHKGTNHLLLFSIDPQSPRVYLMKEKLSNPATPPQFCMVCRKYLDGGGIQSIVQADMDRVLRIQVVSALGTFRFIAEIMGNRSNLIMLDVDGNILDAIRHVPHRLNRFRQVLPNMAYSPPPTQIDKRNPFEEYPEDIGINLNDAPDYKSAIADDLLKSYRGFSPFLAMEIAERIQKHPLAQVWADIIINARENKWNPQLMKNENGAAIGAYPIPSSQIPTNSQRPASSMNEALDAYYSDAIPRLHFEASVKELLGQIHRSERSLEKRKRELEAAIANASKADWWRECADLLVINRHWIHEGAVEAIVSDLYHPEQGERVISLDPSHTIQDNIEKFYHKSRKAADGLDILGHQADQVRTQLQIIQSAIQRISETTHFDPLRQLREELISQGVLRNEIQEPPIVGKSGIQNDFAGRKIRTTHTPDGWEILYGENSEANDYLTTRIARPTDIWLHVRSNPSAHVVIRTNRHPEKTPLDVIRSAAVIAAKHSAAKHSSFVPVDYTLRKYVRKPHGAAPGMVSYQYEKTLHVETGI